MASAGSSAEPSSPQRLPSALEDPELIRRAQLGSAAAFEQLVLSYGPSVHRFLVLRLRNDGDARDTLQETFTAAWQGLPGLQSPHRFRSWLLGIAAHKAADVVRARGPVGDHELELHGREDETLFEIREAIAALPPLSRDVLLLRYVLQLSEEEVALALGMRIGTVKSRTARARAALSELLA